jgi:hypothetical protein
LISEALADWLRAFSLRGSVFRYGGEQMSNEITLAVDGEVDRPMKLSFSELSAIDEAHQLVDVSRFDPKRKGDAVKLEGILELAQVKSSANYIGLHASTDDFHASIPLEPIRENAFLIYRLDGKPLEATAGGPFRFYIPDHAECHTDEIDECANVKFVDRIELTISKGFDNRPEDEEEHAHLHAEQDGTA